MNKLPAFFSLIILIVFGVHIINGELKRQARLDKLRATLICVQSGLSFEVCKKTFDLEKE